MIQRGHLDMPVIGVAKAGLEPRRAPRARPRQPRRARRRGHEAFEKLSSLLRYIDGDYATRPPSTRCARSWARPSTRLHYLAIPPSLFATVICRARPSRAAPTAPGSSSRSRSAATSSRRARSTERSARSSTSGRSSGSITTSARRPVQNLLYFRFAQLVPRADLEPRPRPQRADHDGGELRRRRAGAGSTRRPARSAT